MAERIRAFDWSSTELGPIDLWPQSLRTSVELMLASPVAMVLLWGQGGVMIYNDAYSGFAGGRHPRLLGSKVLEGWPEVADFNRSVMEAGLAGQTLSFRDQQLALERTGVPETVWMDLDYSPVRDETGRPAGVLAVVVETTERVRAQQRLAFVLELAERLLGLTDPAEIKLAAAEALGRRLGVARIGYAEVEADAEHILVEGDWTDGSTMSVAGRHRMEDFGPQIIQELRAGRTMSVADVVQDPRTRGAGADAFAAIDCRSVLAVPLIRKQRLAALLYLHHTSPRLWTPLDISLVEDVAARTWSSVERARVETELKASEQRFRDLVELGPQFIWVSRADGSLEYVNERWLAYSGLDLTATADAERLASAFHPEDIAPLTEGWARAVEEGEAFEQEARLRSREGDYRWFLIRTVPVRGASGTIVKWLGSSTDIHEHKLAEAALRESDARFRAMADSAPAPVFMTDAEGAVAFVNKTFETFAGRSAQELMGNVWLSILHPEDLPRVAERRREAWATHSAYSFEARFRASDGEWLWMLVSARPRFDGDGVFQGYVGMAVDLTERRRAEAELRESERLLRAIGESSPDSIYAKDRQGRMLYVNPATLAVIGRPAEELLGRNEAEWHDDPEQAALIMANDQRIMESGEPERLEEWFTTAGGARRLYQSNKGPIRDASGEVVGLVGITSDITERRRAEDALRESEARFRNMADSAPALIWACDTQAQVTFANRRYESDFGLPAERILRDGWRDIVYVDDVDAFFARFLDAFGRRGHFQAEVRVWDKDRRLRWLRCEAAPRFSGSGEFLGYVGCNVDITEARLAADELEALVAERTAELQAAEESLRQAQKMEAVGQLTGGIAHDFNNLLTAVVGGLDMIQRRAADERIQRLASSALQAAERGAKLTSQLLAFSRTQRLAVQPVPVNEAIARMGELLSGAAGAARLEYVLAPGAGAALTDANQLELAILNLVINARDALGGKGRITISTSRATAAQLAAAGLPDGDYVAVAVSDDGPGMAPEIVARAFDPFYTTKAVGQGTGLGLSQVYGIARQSGGVAVIDSRVGQGTTVSILLPQVEGALATDAADAAPAAADPAARGTVLVVDDDPDVRRFIVDSLDTLGFRVLEAADGPAGLELFEREQPDLLLLDFAMPGMNGAEVAERARRLRPEQRVLFASGYADTRAIEHAAGDAAVLRKPFRLTELAAAVEGALGA
jgi:PAS domain S-box-containing protein